jgi:MoaA/NifB/PqqE/SkfB family radical SAM enzyme
MTEKLCILPWVSVETSPMGEIRPCCLAMDPIVDDQGNAMHLATTTLSAAYNSDYMKNLRQQFINGEKPETCSRCWNEEAAGRTSKRMNSVIRLKNLIENIDFTSTTSDNLIFLDLKLGNICNLKCRICGSFSSSKWSQEEIDIYPNNQLARSNLVQGRWPRENKLFWEDLYDLLPYIRYLEFTGGEPFLIGEHFDLLQQAVDRGLAGNIEIHYNTNTTVVPAKGLELWPHFKLVEIALSIDDIGDRFEYQRYGAKWNQVEINLESFRQLRADSSNIKLQVCMTINVQNVYYMNELIAWVVNQKFDHVYFNMLHDIWYFNIKNLNSVAKQLITEKYKNLTLPYQEEFTRMVTFMNQSDSTDCSKLIEVLMQSDLQRKQHFADHHREIAEAIGYANA